MFLAKGFFINLLILDYKLQNKAKRQIYFT